MDMNFDLCTSLQLEKTSKLDDIIHVMIVRRVRQPAGSDGYKHINETEALFRFDSMKRSSVSV